MRQSIWRQRTASRGSCATASMFRPVHRYTKCTADPAKYIVFSNIHLYQPSSSGSPGVRGFALVFVVLTHRVTCCVRKTSGRRSRTQEEFNAVKQIRSVGSNWNRVERIDVLGE